MSIDLLELAAGALGPLLDEVVFVGGATVTLWITDPGAPPVRPTKDVDGREELVDEVAHAPADVRDYIGDELRALLAAPRFSDGLFGALRPDPGGQARADSVVMPRLTSLTA